MSDGDELLQAKQLVQALPAAVALFDRDGALLAASQRWCDEHNVNLESLATLDYPQNFAELTPLWDAYFARACAGEHIHAEEIEITLPSKRRQVIRWELMPWTGPCKSVAAVVQLVEVVTSQYQARQELLEIRGNLEQKVTERTEELASTLSMLEYAGKANEDFFRNMTHELRTPLHAIINFSNFGQKRFDRLPPEKLIEYFSDINRSGKRLLGLVDDILDFSKQRDGQWRLELALASVARLVSGVVKEASPLAEAKKIDVKVQNALPDLNVRMDVARIHQVLLNVLANAIKFTPHGAGILLDVRHDEREQLLISVIDSGPGIPPEELTSVFNVFEQAKKVESGEFGEGTGLGLAICKQIIDSHAGSIWAENNAEGGAIIRFMLPIANEDGENHENISH